MIGQNRINKKTKAYKRKLIPYILFIVKYCCCAFLTIRPYLGAILFLHFFYNFLNARNVQVDKVSIFHIPAMDDGIINCDDIVYKQKNKKGHLQGTTL